MEPEHSGEFSKAMVEIARLAVAIDAANLQTQIALESAEKLELERISGVQQRLNVASDEREKSAAALRTGTDQQLSALKEQLLALIDAKSEQFRLLRQADGKAIDKAADEYRALFAAANEWRGQSADRERSQAEALAKLTSTFLRADTAEAQFKGLRDSLESQIGELRRLLSDMVDKINKVV